MKIIVLGANGMLGSMFVFYAKTFLNLDIIPLTRKNFDVLKDEVSILNKFLSEDSIVINCIGAIPQKKYSDKEFEKINKLFPHELSSLCKSTNAKLIHISTNCVFSGKNANCSELDIPDATDIYGKSKKEGEPSYGLTVRCSIIGPEIVSFTGLMEWFLSNTSTEVNGFEDSFWNGLTTLELSKIIIDIINHKNITSEVLHFYSISTLSKYELLNTINNSFNKSIYVHSTKKGLKYYTLSSKFTQPRKSIKEQIVELETIYNLYKKYYNL